MSILTANLKHLYQRRGLWLVYAFLGLIGFLSSMAALDSPRAGKGQFVWLVMLQVLVGSMAATLAREVLAKPFSYCLPGHRKTVRKFILWVGVVINLLASLPYLKYPSVYSPDLILVFCSGLFASLIFYWLGVAWAFSLKKSVSWIGFLLWAIIALLFFDLHVVLESAIVRYPGIVVLVGLLSTVVGWLWLGDAGLARRYCAVPWLGLFDAWNKDKQQRYRQARMAVKWDKKLKTSPWLEEFFLTRIRKRNYTSIGKYIWAGFYTIFGNKVPLSGLFVALLLVCLFCYMKSVVVTFTLFFMPGFMVAHLRLPVYSSMLVVGGRNERFFTVLTLVATSAVLITAVATAIAALTMPLAAIMPDITLRGTTFTFHAAYLQPFFVPLLMIPIVFTIQLFFLKNPFYAVVTIMLLFVLLFTGVSGLKALSTMLNPISLVAGLLVLSWAIFVTILYYICMRRCLVGQ